MQKRRKVIPLFLAICDDDIDFCAKLSDTLLHISSTEHNYRVKIFTAAQQLLFELDDFSFDALLLDIDMPVYSGLDIALQIRSKGNTIPIVFLTNYEEYALRSFDVRPHHYLLKPVDINKLHGVLNDIDIQLKIQQKKSLNLHTKSGALRIPFDSILYIESKKHYIYVHTREDVFKHIAKLSVILEKCDSRFLIPHKSFAVNAQNIKTITDGYRNICLLNGTIIPISYRKRPKFLADLREYDDKYAVLLHS